jgi:hypothetical protein
MRRIALVAGLGVVLAVGLMACQRQDDSVLRKLDDIDKRLASLEKSIQSGAAAPGAARPTPAAPPQRPPGPDPDKVYAAPIEGAPFRGGEHAKVTIVEASTFT